MNIEIDDSKMNGLNAIVEKWNAQGDVPSTTPQAYLSARIDEMLASYDAQLITAKKEQFADVINLAATLDEAKKQQLVEFVQTLAS